MTKNEKRDVTRILNLAKKGARLASSTTSMSHGDMLATCASYFTRIAEIAKPMDARTGRKDPSTRKKRAGSGR
jgi:hypothetical protein